jgi:hypothetical protein
MTTTEAKSKLFEIPPIPKAKKFLKPKKKATPSQNRRYKLHQKVKDLCCLKSKQRTIIINYNETIDNSYIKELQDKFKYNIQTEIA